MTRLSTHLKDIIRFEPLLIDILEPRINEQHARILAMMFKLGGYTTLNVLTNKLSMAQPTVSNRVTELVDMGGLIRKNSELMPIALVLLLSVDDLELQLRKRVTLYQDACHFLSQTSDVDKEELGKYSFFQAIDKLYPNKTPYQTYLTQLIANTYLYHPISRDKLFQLVRSNLGESKKLEKELSTIIASHGDIFQIIYQKQQKKEMFIQPRLPLSQFVQSRSNYLDSLFSYYQTLLREMVDLMSSDYDSVTPHESLQYPSEIKRRIDRCLNYYLNVRIIDNSIYKQKSSTNSAFDFVLESQNFSPDHRIKILTRDEIHIPKNINSSQVSIRPLDVGISRDYMTRDFIIFENHGCIVFPPQPSDPYYNISPQFTSPIIDTFNSIWRKKGVN